MKNKKNILLFFVFIIASIFSITCENPLVAKWWDEKEPDIVHPPLLYSVLFNTNGGSPEIPTQYLLPGELIAEPEQVVFAEHLFLGWYTVEGNIWDFNNDTMPAQNITLYALWVHIDSDIDINDPDSFIIVNFISNGGNEISPMAVAVGNLIPEPSVTRENYYFGGWFFDNETFRYEFDFSQPVSNTNITLYAKWLEHHTYYTVLFEVNGGIPSIPSQSLTEGELIPKPIQIYKILDSLVYDFAGWYTADGTLWDFDNYLMPASDIALFALWSFGSGANIMVTYVSNNEEVLSPEFYKPGDRIIQPVISKVNHKFNGWYLDPDFEFKFDFTKPVSNVDLTLYANWVYVPPPVRTIIFDPNGGGPDNTFPKIYSNVQVGTRLIDPPNPGNPGAPSRTGYTFIGWFHDPACTPGNGLRIMDYTVPAPVFDEKEDDAIYFYAGWMTSRLYITFNIIDPGGTNTGKVADQYVNYGDLVHLPIITPEADRYLDGSWYKDQACTVKWNFDTDKVTANTDLYTKRHPAGHEVSFTLRVPPGGLDPIYESEMVKNIIKTQYVLDGGVAVEPFMPPNPPDSEKHSFLRWDTSPDDGATFTGTYSFDTPVTKNITLYARWVPPVPDMVWVPRGSFIMGDSGVSGSPAAYHAYPTRRVTLDGYYISRYEITQENSAPLSLVTGGLEGYSEVMGSGNNHSQFTGIKSRPVENVSWENAMNYCDALNLKYSLASHDRISPASAWAANGYRLPTEAEWEYAARGGYYWQDNYSYAGSNNANDVAWFNTTVKEMPSGYQTTQTVGLKAPNQLGIYDMSGNLSEWCYDWFAPYNTLQSQLINPTGGSGPYPQATSTGRVRRGGAWNNAAGNVRVTVRNSEDPGAAHWAVGFRVVRGPSEIY